MDRSSRPPKIMERIAGLLMPVTVREQVLGDLHERYRSPLQYLTDVVRTVPWIMAGRARRKLNQPILVDGGRAMLKYGGTLVWLGFCVVAVMSLPRMTELQMFLLLILPFPLKAVALWKAALRHDKWWFVVLLISQTAGTLDVIYLFSARKSVPEEHSVESPNRQVTP